MSSEQIKKLLFPATNKHTMLRRLRKLKQEEILNRLEVSRGGQVLWYLTQKHVELMGESFVIKTINKNVLVHDLMVNDLRILFEQRRLGSNWRSSHYLRYKLSSNKKPEERASDTIPDWLVNINNRVTALELELHPKGKERILKVFRTYANNKAVSLLWYIVPNEVMRKKLLRYSVPFTDIRGKSWLKVTLFSELEHELSLLTPHAHSVSRVS